MFTSEQIEEVIVKVKKLRDAKDIDISEIKNPADLRKAYLIRKIVSEELKKINPEIKDSTINKFANREIRERIINNYIEKKSTQIIIKKKRTYGNIIQEMFMI